MSGGGGGGGGGKYGNAGAAGTGSVYNASAAQYGSYSYIATGGKGGNGGGSSSAIDFTGTSVVYGSGGYSDTPGSAGWNANYANANPPEKGLVAIRYGVTGGSRAAGTTLKVVSGAGALSFASNASNLSRLIHETSSNNNFAGALMGTTGLTKLGTGTLSLTNTNTQTGTTYINAGTLQVGNGGATGSLGFGDVVNNTALIFNSTGNSVAGGVISGAGTFTKMGSGTVALLAANTYTSPTTLIAGTLGIYNNTAASTGAINAADGTTLLFGRGVTNFANNVSMTGSVTFDLDNAVEYLIVGGGGGGGGGAG